MLNPIPSPTKPFTGIRLRTRKFRVESLRSNIELSYVDGELDSVQIYRPYYKGGLRSYRRPFQTSVQRIERLLEAMVTP